MKASELRIGNLVNARKTNHTWDQTCLITGLTHKGIYVKYDNGHIIPINIEPILLTEEWLLSMGFISNPYQDRYENVVIHVECNKTRGVTELWIDKMPHIKYLHELQNLYFALTGKELEYEQN